MAMKRVSFEDMIQVILGRGAVEKRTLTEIVGTPGSGKSTLAGQLTDALKRLAPNSAIVVPMDGNHYDDIVLDARGIRDRKGSPDVFDVASFRHMLVRLQNDTEEQIAIPLFDRSLAMARHGAQIIDRNVRPLIVDGNYLLLDQAPSGVLREIFRTTVMVDAKVPTLRDRRMRRWVGLGIDAEEVGRKVEGNDLPDAELVVNGSAAAEFVVPAE